MMRPARITNEMGLPRMDFTGFLNKARQYIPMDPIKKQDIVTKFETSIRDAAWMSGRLNPLIGTDSMSSEPTWDSERNLIQ